MALLLVRSGTDRQETLPACWHLAVLHLAVLLLGVLALGPGCRKSERTQTGGPLEFAPPPGGYRVRITGEQFRWHIRYPGADGVLDTPDDVRSERFLHLPADIETKIDLTSRDYLYSFKVAQFKVKEIAVPDITMHWTAPATRPGTFELRGDQLCGFSHPELMGKVVVESHAEFARWLAVQRATYD